MRCRAPFEELVASVVLSLELYCVLTTRSGGSSGFATGGAGFGAGAAGFAGGFGAGRFGCCAAATFAATQQDRTKTNSLGNALFERFDLGSGDRHLHDRGIAAALSVAIGPDSSGTSGSRHLRGLFLRTGALGQRVEAKAFLFGLFLLRFFFLRRSGQPRRAVDNRRDLGDFGRFVLDGRFVAGFHRCALGGGLHLVDPRLGIGVRREQTLLRRCVLVSLVEARQELRQSVRRVAEFLGQRDAGLIRIHLVVTIEFVLEHHLVDL